ncbi:MAG: class I SAM-dependent methyltransferase [Acidobacteriota bacterium]|nr:MAG: class I SAM-dependent methyltransferase [Acidobacteriota bacterium]
MTREDWDRRYATSEFVWTAEPNRFLVEKAADLVAGRALDVATGEGRNAVWLAERGWKVTAVDYSGVGLDKARRLAQVRGVSVEWVLADVTRDSFEQPGYELVIIFYLHLPWREMTGVIRRAARATVPGGQLLLVGHDRSNLDHGHGGPKSPEVLYVASQVTDVLGELEDLRIIEAGRRERSVDTGEGEAIAIDCLVHAQRVAERTISPRPT